MKRLALFFILFTIYSVSYGIEWKNTYKVDVISETNIGYDNIVNLGNVKTNITVTTNIDSAIFLSEDIITNDDELLI